MSTPDASISILDGSLGIVASGNVQTQAKVGVCSLGTPNTVYAFSDPTDLKATLGTGPLVEAALAALEDGGGPIVCVPVASDVAGTIGAVAVGASNTGTGTVAVTGTPLDSAELVVQVVLGATNLAAAPTFKYSLDGGRSFSGTIAMVASYVVPNTGLTIGFTNGGGTSWVAGDTWTSAVVGPGYSNGNLLTALAALAADTTSWFAVHIVGQPASAAAAATLFAAVEAFMQAQGTAYRYALAVLECPADTDANIKTAFASTSGTRTALAVGFCAYTSRTSGAAIKRSSAWPIMARLSSVSPHVDPGQVSLGALTGTAFPKGFTWRNEGATPGLYDFGCLTLRTYTGLAGVYCTGGVLLTAAGSDYRPLMNRRVMDVATAAIRAATLQLLNKPLRVDATSGKILEAEAQNIETQVGAALNQAVVAPGYATKSSVVVNRTDNVLSTGSLRISERVLPFGYARQIQNTVGFTNPALQAS